MSLPLPLARVPHLEPPAGAPVPRNGRRSSVARRPSLISGGQSNAPRPEVQELAARAKDSAAAQLAVKLYETAVTGGDVGGIQAYVREGKHV